MISSTPIKTGLALSLTAAVLAGGPAIAQSMGLGSTPPANHSVAWEASQQRDAQNASASNQAVLEQRAEQERKAKAKAEAKKKKAAEERRRKAQAAARSRAQGGTPAQNRALGMQMCANEGWSASQCADLGTLWQKESGWNSRAHNPSGAHGIPQALPGSKMASAGPNWQSNPRTQIAWGLDYIRSTYGNPSNAWSHSVNSGWY